MNRIHIPHNLSIRLAQPEQIIRVEACSNYSKIYFAAGYPLTVPKVLQWFQARLPPKMFTRVHRSHLVNKNFIEQVNDEKQNIYC